MRPIVHRDLKPRNPFDGTGKPWHGRGMSATKRRARVCACGHEESFHLVNRKSAELRRRGPCNYGHGTAMGGCSCPGFHGRRGGGSRVELVSGAQPVKVPLAARAYELHVLAETMRELADRMIATIANIVMPAAETVQKHNGAAPRGHKRERAIKIVGHGGAIDSDRFCWTKIADGERRVLAAIAQHGAGGVTRELLTILTGYKRSTRDTYIQRLRARELVEVWQSGNIVATAKGVRELGPAFKKLPVGDALRAHWLERLPEGERRVLEVVVEAYPNGALRDFITAHTNYARSTRDTYIQRLRTRRLVSVDSEGIVRAAEELFGNSIEKDAS